MTTPRVEQNAQTGLPQMAEQVHAEALAAYGAGRYAESEALYRALAGRPGWEAEGRYGTAVTQIARGQLADGMGSLTEALRIDPRHSNALYQLGRIAEQRGDRSTALAHYRHALAANARHASAAERVRQLERRSMGTPDTASTVPLREREPGDVDRSRSDLGVYEFLREDSSVLARRTVDAMDGLRVNLHPHVTASLDAVLRRAAIGVVVGIFVALGPTLANAVLAFLSTGPSRPTLRTRPLLSPETAILIGLALAAGLAIWKLVEVFTARVRIRNGRLQISQGVVARRVRNIELSRVQNVDLEQSFLNRLTGDGTLVFTVYGEKRPFRVAGVARGKDLYTLHTSLLNLAFLLRGNPVVKGIIV